MKKFIYLVFIFFISCSTESKDNNTIENQDETFPRPEISIYPSNPIIGDIINVDYHYAYPDVDSVVFNWVVGEDTVVENLQHLITTNLSSGILIKCLAKVFYSDKTIRIFFSNEVMLLPLEEAEIAAVLIGPDSVTAKDQVHLQKVDIVGDKSRLEFTIQWFVNNNIISGAKDSVLSLANFKHGDQIVVKLKYGINNTEANSNPIIVSNSAPEIISMPPTTELTETGYQYQLMAQDADRDILVYSLLQKPESMTIDRNTGLIQWHNPIEGNYNIQVEVIDNFGGKTSQQFNLRIGEINNI